jgi:hypothetical protein
MPAAPVNTVVLDQRLGVDAPALPVEGVGLLFGQSAREDMRADHLRTIVLFMSELHKPYFEFG